MPPPPHILLINPDQWRGDVLGHWGNPAAVTPNLDRLARTDGVSFANAFCQNPVCTPSRCSFMTGWYPHVRGHRTMFHMLQPDEPMLLRTLKEAGYHVWWGGKNDLVSSKTDIHTYCDVRYRAHARPGRPVAPNAHALTAWRGPAGGDNYYSFLYGKIEKPDGFPADEDFVYDGDWDVVFEAIRAIKERPKDRPICLFLALGFPHPPYGVEEPWYSAIDRARIPPRTPTPADWSGLPSILKGIYERQGLQHWAEERWTELRAVYYGMCARVDHQIGLLLDALREAGIYDDTAVFVFSDHGDFTGDYGLVEKTQNTFEDCLTHVPLVIKPPRGSLTPRMDQKAAPSDPSAFPLPEGEGENLTPLPPSPLRREGGKETALVELVDIPATVLEMAGIEIAYTQFGRSLVPLLRGQVMDHRDAVFSEGGRLRGERHAMELESEDNQVPTGLYYPRLSLQRSAGPEHTKATMCRTKDFKYVRRLYESDELYDLREDPREEHNRINDPALAGVLAELKDRLLTFYQETADVVPWQQDTRG